MKKPWRKARKEAPPTAVPVSGHTEPTASSHDSEPATGQPSPPQPPAGSTLEFWIGYAHDIVTGPPVVPVPNTNVPGVHPAILQEWEEWLAKTGEPPTWNQLRALVACYAARNSGEDEYLATLDTRFNMRVEEADGRESEFENCAMHMGRMLRTAWADVKLWKMIRGEADPHVSFSPFHFYLANHYWLHLLFPASVWDEMSRQPKRRNMLFGLMLTGSHEWFHSPTQHPLRKYDLDDLRPDGLDDDLLAPLLITYVDYPSDDLQRAALAWRQLPAASLRTLKAAAEHLAADADWCLKHPGQRWTTIRSPRQPRRLMSLETVQHLESMVAMLKANPTLSDYALAKEHFGPTSSTQRGLASEARKLASLRDGLNLPCHKRRGA
jgi:hypothetical protein